MAEECVAIDRRRGIAGRDGEEREEAEQSRGDHLATIYRSGVIVRMIGFSLNLIRAGAKQAGWKLYVFVGANGSEECGLLSLMEFVPRS